MGPFALWEIVVTTPETAVSVPRGRQIADLFPGAAAPEQKDRELPSLDDEGYFLYSRE